MSIHFHVIVPVSDAGDLYLSRTLASIAGQKGQKCSVSIVDDGCQKESVKAAITSMVQEKNWTYLIHDIPKGVVESLSTAIDGREWGDDVVHLLVRGGDWLLDDYILNYLAETYNPSDAQFVYSQFIYALSCEMGYSKKVKRKVRKKCSFRRQRQWIFGPLYSFRHQVWERAQFHDHDGVWSQCLVLPLLEAAAPYVKYAPEILYAFNEAV